MHDRQRRPIGLLALATILYQVLEPGSLAPGSDCCATATANSSPPRPTPRLNLRSPERHPPSYVVPPHAGTALEQLLRIRAAWTVTLSRRRTLGPSRLSWRPPPPSDVVWVAGSGPRPHAPDIERVSALAARNDRVHVVVARGVVENKRRKVAAQQPFVTERRHNRKDRTHVAARVRKAVLVAHWALLVGHLIEQTLIHEAVEPGSQDVAPGAQLALELLEPPRAEARLAKDEQRPAVADEIGGAGATDQALRDSAAICAEFLEVRFSASPSPDASDSA